MTIDDVWTEKYRPQKIEDVLLNEELSSTLSNLTCIPNNLLFTGRPGIGKTTVAKILAKKFAPNSYMYINASEQGTIDVLREKIQGFVDTASFDGNPKVIILDELDGGSQVFSQALRVVMEEYLSDVKFILTANYRNKIIEAIRSRCIEYSFNCTERDILKRIVHILKSEKIIVSKEDSPKIRQIIKTKFPDIRKTINELQAHCLTGTFIYNKSENSQMADYVKSRLKKDDVFAIRKHIIDNSESFDNDYHSLMKHLFDLYVSECNTTATVLISEYMYRSAFVADQEINFSALLVNLHLKL